ncbi:post-GPI attachment to proteins factor 2-like isoform X1 [Anastrepha ludens]|uniref:post-GPI attachment to proteins factor 2-like isoform X1 n=1 Tax=Anastrepha ludens TaxID=28586 RepID=UPI0023B12F11|nr:post-GPI attachment to proteins factor 2-like isoform X1 [Anastrepha ludens]
MLPTLTTYDRLDGPKPLFCIPFGKVAIGVVSLPLGSFIFCVVWSLFFEFDRSTSTHCDVPNYLPSISAAIGNYEPQKTVWRLAITLQLPARLAVTKIYLQYYKDTIRRNRRIYAAIACLLSMVENFALLSLSLWTSLDNYPIHRNSFIVFIACSEIYMLISYILNKNGRRLPLLPIEEKSLLYKRNLFITNVTAFILAGYCFLRHNSLCEPGVYTLFALFEYVVVLTNMAYHMTAYWDFHAMHVCFDWERGLYLSQF